MIKKNPICITFPLKIKELKSCIIGSLNRQDFIAREHNIVYQIEKQVN